jgi:hypothetical protein
MQLWLKSFLRSILNIGKEVPTMLWTIFVVILIIWALGFAFHIAGGLIHILLVLALISLIYNLVRGRKTR